MGKIEAEQNGNVLIVDFRRPVREKPPGTLTVYFEDLLSGTRQSLLARICALLGR